MTSLFPVWNLGGHSFLGIDGALCITKTAMESGVVTMADLGLMRMDRRQRAKDNVGRIYQIDSNGQAQNTNISLQTAKDDWRVAIECITTEPVTAKIPMGAEALQHVIARVYAPSSLSASNWKFKMRMETEGFAAVDRTLQLWELFNEISHPSLVALTRLRYAGFGGVAAGQGPAGAGVGAQQAHLQQQVQPQMGIGGLRGSPQNRQPSPVGAWQQHGAHTPHQRTGYQGSPMRQMNVQSPGGVWHNNGSPQQVVP